MEDVVQSSSSNSIPPGDAPDLERRRFLQGAGPALLLPGLTAPTLLAGPAGAASAPAEELTNMASVGSGAGIPEPFRIGVPQAVLDDLQARLAQTRWPDEIDGAGWDYGANREYLKELSDHWQHGYDWRGEEEALNRFPQFTVTVDGVDLHFVHIVGKGPNPMPLLLTHGWPDSFYRFVKMLPLLTDPASHGGRPEDAFTVVVPDIPGFGFSQKPTKPGTEPVRVSGLFAQLMTEVLGYETYVAHGGDYGASITEQLALHHPEGLLAIHLNNVPPQHAQKARPEDVSDGERAYLLEVNDWGQREGAFTHVQSTKPQTLSYGLNDSPVGLLAWIVEKFHDWVDSDGHLERVIGKDELLTNVMIYWVTQTIGSASRIYYEKAHHPAAEPSYVTVPTGFAVFEKDLTPAPRLFAARFFNIQRWTELPRGGHFAAFEVPDALTAQLRDFFGPYRRG